MGLRDAAKALAEGQRAAGSAIQRVMSAWGASGFSAGSSLIGFSTVCCTMNARSKSPGAWPICRGSVGLAATRTVVSGVAAATASTCESERSALMIAIAIVRFFSISKSPISQPEYRLVQPNARSPGAAIAKQARPSAQGSRPHSLAAVGAKSIPIWVSNAPASPALVMLPKRFLEARVQTEAVSRRRAPSPARARPIRYWERNPSSAAARLVSSVKP